MAGRTGITGRIAAALMRRLLFVALFLFGLGEWPSNGESSGTRAALEAGRAMALAAGDTPPTQFLGEDERGRKVQKGLGGGGEDERAAAFAGAGTPPVEAACGIRPGRAASAAPQHGFSSRAPPCLT